MSTRKTLLTISPGRVKLIFTKEDYKKLRSLGQVVRDSNKEMSDKKIMTHIEDVEIVISGSKPLTRKALEKAGNLRVYAETSGAIPRLSKDLYENAFKRGIYILSCSPAFAVSVAEMALGLIINLLRNIPNYHIQMRSGTEQFGYCPQNSGDREFTGKQIGIVGLGSVARAFIKLIKPFNVKIRIFDPFVSKKLAKKLGVELVELHEMLSKSDAVVLMANPNPSNEGLLDRKAFRSFKQGAVLVNVARAVIVETDALLEWLKKGKGKAALDVFDKEPLPVESPLRKLPNVILTPHRAGGLAETYQRIGRFLVQDLQDILKGEEPHRMLKATPEMLRRLYLN
jgi:phosphoglycerate dehydrogenase-like enzyme